MPRSDKRPQKGTSLLAFPNNYVVLDIETTGLDPDCDDIIEISALKCVADESIDTFSTLIKAPFGVSDFIADFTGITNEMLEAAPVISDIFLQFLEFLGDNIIIGHNVNFDVNFLYDTSLKICGHPLQNDFVDTMRLSRRMFPDEAHNRLSDLILRFGIGTDVSHRAESDARQTHAVYLHLKSLFQDGGYSNALELKRHSTKYLKAGDISPDTDNLQLDSDICGKVFCFTGSLNSFTRAEAMQEVVNRGGLCADTVRKDVNYLVIGGSGYKMELENGKSKKWISAEKLMRKGHSISVISENVFLDMLNP